MVEVTATEPARTEAHRSRWGFHPCSWETHKKLCFLNRVYQAAVQKAAAWKRWERKAPHNRVARPRVRDASGRVVGYGEPTPLGEPRLCPVFSSLATRKVVWHPTKGYNANGQDLTEPVLDDHRVPEAARMARSPVATPGEVKGLPLTAEEIDRLWAAAGGR